MPRSCYIQLSAAIDGSLSLSLSSPLLDEENRGRHIRSAANSNNSWLARSHEGRLSKPLQGNLWPLRKRGEKREREKGKKKRRRRREKKIACSRLWSRARPECRAFLLESRKWTTLAKLPATRHRASVFPFFFPSTDSFPRPRGTANGAWMSWMSCLPAETPDVLNATSNIDTRRSLGQDAWPLLSFPSCLLAFVRTY